MKNIALITAMTVVSQAPLMGGELQNLRSSNAEQKRQITELENQLDNLYSLLEKANKGTHVTIPPKNKASLASSTYTVAPGDTLSKISAKMQVSVSSLMVANNLTAKSILQIGQKLTLPSVNKSYATASKLKPLPPLNINTSKDYVVSPGDTFYSIARKNNVTVNSLTASNPSVTPTKLKVGQKLFIPSKLSSAAINASKPIPKAVLIKAPLEKKDSPRILSAKTNGYKITSGDTMFSLAKRYNTTITAISNANPNINPNALAIGQHINIPTNASYTAAPKAIAKKAPVAKAPYTKPALVKMTTTTVQKSLPAPIVKKKDVLPALPPVLSSIQKESEPIPAEPVILSEVMTMQTIADKNLTTVEAINILNSWSYSSDVKLAKGSEVYLP